MSRFSIQFLPEWPGAAWYDDELVPGSWCVIDEERAPPGRPAALGVTFSGSTFDSALDWIRALPDG